MPRKGIKTLRFSMIAVFTALLISTVADANAKKVVKDQQRSSKLSMKDITPSPINMCGLELGAYDYYNLTARVWKFQEVGLASAECIPVNGSGIHPDECEFIMSLCQPITSVPGCEASSWCQSSVQGNISIGGFVQDPFKAIVPKSGSDGFKAILPNGGSYTTRHGKTCILHMEIDFECNPDSIWHTSSSSSQKAKASEPSVVTFDEKSCKMSVRFKYAGACKQNNGNSSEDLSAGSMLIIIFVVTLILYFTFGCMINISRGRTGQDLIPHAHFWTMLPVYIMDGIRFTFSCGRLPVTSTHEYTYDQI